MARSAAAASDALAARDARIAAIVERVGPCRLGRRPAAGARFETLAVAIVSQQLAGKAADAIWGRVLHTVGAPFTAKRVLSTPFDALRAAGLSQAKALSLVDLARRVDDGALDLAALGRRSDAEVTAALTAVRGIGPWTADMFMIFALQRLDIWPVGDLGVRNGFARIFELPAAPTSVELVPLADAFRPYRSVLAWYCWRAVDG